ncbi:MAG: hypothetical protein K9J06_06435 [Flavobacteriales bacterium]|nr:hypothetical protein [Flavobacteriales bacterium]
MSIRSTLLLFCLFPLLLMAQEAEIVRFYYPDGALSSEGPMVNGRPNGYWRTYYPSGSLKSEGNRSNHQLDSLWSFYAESGVLENEIFYGEDKRNGPARSYDETGSLARVELYRNDVRVDRVEEYYSNGKLRELTPIDSLGSGKEQGLGYEYDEQDGRVISVVTYANGYVRNRERINRKDKFNQRQGVWRTYHDNMVVYTEGKFRSDQKDGYWKEFDKNGNLVQTLKYDNGILIAEPEELAKIDIKKKYYPNAQVSSVGSYVKGVEEGVHRFYSMDGKVESARIYRVGKVIGEGIVDPEGKRQGEWKEFYETGELRSKGRYENNKREGRWVFYYRTGKVEQEGDYRKGLADGEWKWTHPNGMTWREEIFYEGKEEGLAVEYSDTGKVVAKGMYMDGEREGAWLIDVGEHREEGDYRLGQRSGVWKFHYHNNKLKFEGKYVDGREEGVHNQYYSTGQLKLSGRYKFGEMEGDWTEYSEDGTVRTIVTYERGMVVKVDGVNVQMTKGDKVN